MQIQCSHPRTRSGHTIGARADHCLKQAFLGGKVLVDRHLRDARIYRDGFGVAPLETMRIKVAARRFEDAPQ